MFDVGFGELVLIFLIALIVLGPDKLPKAAAVVGRFVGRARGYFNNFMQQLEEEANRVDPREDLNRWKDEVAENLKIDTEGLKPKPKSESSGTHTSAHD